MNITAIVQARMNSSRLPGKVMMEIEGKPLLGYLLERLEECEELDDLIVACPGDGVIAYPSLKTWFFRSTVNENDVAGRILAAAKQIPETDAICRICADSPLLDPSLIDQACEIYRANEPEIVINARRGFPDGQNVEVFSRQLLEASYPCMSAEEKEHVTIGWRRDLQDYPAVVFRAGWLIDPPSFAVDTREDFEKMTRLIQLMDRPHVEYDWQDLIELEKRL